MSPFSRVFNFYVKTAGRGRRFIPFSLKILCTFIQICQCVKDIFLSGNKILRPCVTFRRFVNFKILATSYW